MIVAAKDAASVLTSVPRDLINDVQQRLAFFEMAQVLAEQGYERGPVVLHGARGVGRDDDVREVPVRARWLERFARKDVERCSAQPAVSQRVDDCRIVNQL